MDNFSVEAEFTEGYTFRYLTEYLKNVNGKSKLIFTEDKICCYQGDLNNTVLNEVEIRRGDLTKYEFRDNEEISNGIDLNNLYLVTKPIGKKDGMRLFVGKDRSFYIQHIRPDTKQLDKNLATVKSCTIDDKTYKMVTPYSRDENHPNCSVPVKDFHKICKALETIKYNYVTIKGFNKGIMFAGCLEGGFIGNSYQLGECISSQSKLDSNVKVRLPEHPVKIVVKNTYIPGEIISINVRGTVIKWLVKLNNLSGPGGIIKFYVEKNRPLKIICNIGIYGKLTIYLRDASTQNVKVPTEVQSQETEESPNSTQGEATS